MIGAESLVRTLLASGVDTCFANPGTSELYFISALDRVPGMRCVLGLFEGVVTGAADGYARMTGRPAATLLHCGPGLANGLSSLHNARRANSPIVNVVGDTASFHRPLDPALTADTEGFARPVSAWVRTASSAVNLGEDGAVAVQAARTSPGRIATLIVPADISWGEGGHVATPLPVPAAPQAAPGTVKQVAAILRRGEPAVIFLGGKALLAEGLPVASRIAAACGVRLLAQQSNARIQRGQGRVPLECVPYAMALAQRALAGTRHVILAGIHCPVALFAYPNQRGSVCPNDAEVHVLARPEQDAVQALKALAEELHAPAAPAVSLSAPPEPARGPLVREAVGQTLAALIPEEAIVIDEGVSFGAGFYGQTQASAPHDWLQHTGASLGMGLPMAIGAALGAPGRRVIVVQADGSAMYTVQALWTQARERLDVTTLVLANRKYAILAGELANLGGQPGPVSGRLMDLGNPELNWVKIANGMGVEAAQAQDCDELASLLTHSLGRRGPFLIELLI